MSLAEGRTSLHTLDEWKTWEGRWELIHGVPHNMTPVPSLEHQQISAMLHLEVGNALGAARQKQGGGECQVLAAPLDVFLLSSVVQPDLVVVCDTAKLSPRGVEGAPDLVVEILRPGTAHKDLTSKRWLYEGAGVPEYLVVYPEAQRAELLMLGPDGFYRTQSRVEWGQVLVLLAGRIEITVGFRP